MWRNFEQYTCNIFNALYPFVVRTKIPSRKCRKPRGEGKRQQALLKIKWTNCGNELNLVTY